MSPRKTKTAIRRCDNNNDDMADKEGEIDVGREGQRGIQETNDAGAPSRGPHVKSFSM